MYIPIGPSKKDLYKIIIALLLLCYCIFMGMYKPKAQVISADLGVSDLINNTSETMTISRNMLGESGSGSVIFSLKSTVLYTQYQIYRNIQSIVINTNNGKHYQCNIGNRYEYNDAGRSVEILSPVCPVDLRIDYITSITIKAEYDSARTQGLWIQTSPYITFYSDDSSSDEIVSAIQSQTTSIVNAITNNQTTINNIQNNTQNISDNLNDSSIDSSSANDFTSNSAFQDNNGLDAIIKAPLNFIRSLTSSTCSSINLTIPYIDADVSLPCMSSIYNKALGQQLVNLIALVINGVVLYRYCLKILQIVKDAKNPNKDGLEVLDL